MANVTVSFGPYSFIAEPTTAYKGYAGRVYPTPEAAVSDMAANTIAKEVYRKVQEEGDPPLKTLIGLAQKDPALFRTLADLAEFMNTNKL